MERTQPPDYQRHLLRSSSGRRIAFELRQIVRHGLAARSEVGIKPILMELPGLRSLSPNMDTPFIPVFRSYRERVRHAKVGGNFWGNWKASDCHHQR